MSSFADNKNVSESTQQQSTEKQQTYNTEETLETTNKVIDNSANKNLSEKAIDSEAVNQGATTKASVTTSEISKISIENLNKSTNVTFSGQQSLTIATSSGPTMPPGDIEQQVECDSKRIIHSDGDNQRKQGLKFTTGSGDTLNRPHDGSASTSHVLSEASAVPSQSPTPTTASSPLPPLPPGLGASFGTHLPHISSEPTFGVQLRNKQQDQSSTKGTLDNTATYYNNNSGSVSASASPNMVRKASDGSMVIPRRVSFPKSDDELVTGYLEPANPWEHVCMVKSISEIAELYMTSCQKHNTMPLQSVLDHLKAVDLTKQLRQPMLSLKSIQLAPSDCEALEEVLKRVQYKAIDFSDCKLNEIAASALFDMIEYYEATNELDISSNAQGMTHRGWISCTYMISHSRELLVLNAEGNPITKLSADHLGNALNTSNLHTLKLEHCNLKGAPLSGLCFKLWHNRVLKELWIAYNELDSNDADTIAEMLKVNHYLELIDISNNNIGDDGLRHIVMSLIMQSKELERRTTFQRTAAIDDDESMSPFESSPPVDLCGGSESSSGGAEWRGTDDNGTNPMKEEVAALSEPKCKKPLSTIEERNKSGSSEESSCLDVPVVNEPAKPVSSFKPPLISTVGSTIEEIDPDEDTDETVRSSTLKNGAAGGQSMLDKLLSMNSESSSEDGVSNLSTDTLAAYCSEEASLISDDIFDIGSTATTTITIACANVNSPAMEDSGEATATVSVISNPTIASSVTRSAVQDSLREEASVVIDNAAVKGLSETANTVLSEAPTKLPATSAAATQSSIVPTSHVNVNANNNNNNDNNNANMTQSTSSSVFPSNLGEQIIASTCVFEVKADDRNCSLSGGGGVGGVGSDEARESMHLANVMPQHAASKALDVNKNTKLGEDFDDTHSTDSAFESASEGDISRHLPEEFTRLSASLESTRLDDIAKEFSIETATIASESNECLIAAVVHVTPSSTPTPQKLPFAKISTPLPERDRTVTDSQLSTSLPSAADGTITPPAIHVGFGVVSQPAESLILDPVGALREKMPKVTIAQDSIAQKYKTNSVISTSPSQTPPPPSTSPGGASIGLRRTESSCAFLTQSTRNRSQSTDSLCSENSLDGSIGSGDLNFSSSAQLNEKLTKNDTLSRQQRHLDSAAETSVRSPGGLKALALWNNNLSKDAGLHIANLLSDTVSLELLNIGKNCLTNEFVSSIKDSLTKNTTLTTLGLQSAHLSAEGIETLTSIMTFGGNSTLQRIDIRGNKVEVESLSKIAEVLKSNTTVTQIDIDDEPKRLSVGSEAHLDYARVLENVRSMCARNEKSQAQMQQEKSSANPPNKRRGGYYLGSRKISLTCHSRPIIDTSSPVVLTCSAPSNSKLDVKRKPGTRLRSPVPSPTTISPSSSPNRASRFQVFRVAEVSPLTSPNIQKHMGGLAGTKAMSSSSVFIQSVSSDGGNVGSVYPNITSTSLPTSCSLPSMATISSSTQSIKRLSVSPRSRFHVRKIYEDPSVPLASRTIPPITPPINPPPTPISKNAKETLAQQNTEATPPDAQTPFTSPTIVTQPTIPSPYLASMSPSSTSITQQLNNTTTDSCATPILNVREHPPATQREQSTNTTKSNDNITNQSTIAPFADTTSNSSTLQPSPSILSTLSAFSSSSSNSDTSPSSTSSASSSSSSSSTSPASNIDSTDSSSSSSVSPPVHSAHETLIDPHDLTVSGQCPIAVFGDNDITLTKNSVNEAFVSAAASAVSNEGMHTFASDVNVAPTTTIQQQRVRKVSWIANPTAVDKLLTLFHNPFQRSSSPESKGPTIVTTSVTTASPGGIHTPVEPCPTEQHQHLHTACNKSLMPLRKQSPPSWSKLGTDILTAAGSNNVDLANTVSTTAAAVVTEQSRSFLDAAYKPFRDFSKQVFRQNLSFGNEAVTTGSTTTITSSTVNNPNSGAGAVDIPCGEAGSTELTEVVSASGSGGGGGSVCVVTSSTLPPNVECHADYLPSDIKLEIKENISPEHTINEETLHTMQKLYGSTTAVTSAVTTTSCTSDFRHDREDHLKTTSNDTQTRFENE